MIYITEGAYLKDYLVELKFSNGLYAVVNLEEDVFSDHRTLFKQLQNKDYFKSVKYDPDCVSICWDNGVDFAPDYLYGLAQKQIPISQAHKLIHAQS
jgi:hypothetical protein